MAKRKIEAFIVARPCSRCGGSGREKVVSGKALRAAREAAGLTLREMARRIHCSASYVSDLELDRRGASEETLAKLLEALG